jgi:N-acetylglutamate synthase-like GNAT family acetyltransferase
LKIRRASSEETARLTQIAHDAKRYWGYPELWIQRWQAELTISPDFISDNDVYVAEQEGELVGFYALVARKDKAELEHMWVAPAYIGTGVGKELFIHAMQRAAGQNLSEVEICSDPNAEGFYKKMGATRIGEVAAELDGQARVLPHLKIDPGRS